MVRLGCRRGGQADQGDGDLGAGAAAIDRGGVQGLVVGFAACDVVGVLLLARDRRRSARSLLCPFPGILPGVLSGAL